MAEFSEKGRMSQLDRWVFAALTIISLSLIVASVIRGDNTYLAYLGGPATLVLIYFIFVR
jgi:hypothetical protein